MENTIGYRTNESLENDENTKIESELERTITDTVTDRVDSSKEKESTICIAGYDIRLKLGEGGMGAVYLADDTKLGRSVAIKVISGFALRSRSAKDRFAKEIKSVAALSHPNIAQLYSASEENSVPYFVMEFVDGCPLDERLKHQPLKPEVAAALLKKLALAIQHCHDQGIIHRDLKPSNILMDSNDEPKIADFGLAKSFNDDISTTQTGDLVGTPAYMSPEQARGALSEIGPATDVYGLGAVLYHALTGHMPFAAPTVVETVSKVTSTDPIPPTKILASIPQDLETICLKCLSKDKTRRYSSARELANDLHRYLNSEPIHARPVSIIERMVKWARRRPALAALVAVLCVGAPTAFAWQAINASTLRAALDREQKALKQADEELEKSQRLSEGASELTTWLLQQHQTDLGHLNGSLKVVNELQSKIRTYLDGAILDMPDESKFVRRLANSYIQLATSMGGENVSNLGNHDEALMLMNRAMGLFDRALEIDPTDQIALNLKTRGLLAIFDLQMSMGKSEDAETSLTKAAELFNKNGSDQSKDRRLLRLFLLQAKIGKLQFEQKLDPALLLLQSYEQAIYEGDELALDFEEAEHQMVWKLKAESETLKGLGKYDEALSAAERGLVIAQKSLDRQPDSSTAINRLANLQSIKSEMQLMNRQFEEAVATLIQAAELRQQHFEKNSDDSMAKFNLANSWGALAGAYMQVRMPEKELEYAQKSLVLFDDLAKSSPGNQVYQRTLAEAFRNVGAAQVSNQLFDEAIRSYRQAIGIVDRLMPVSSSVSLLGFKAELALQSGLVYFQKLTTDPAIFDNDAGEIRDRDEFKLALQQFERSKRVFEEASEIGELTYQQEYIQNQVKQAKTMMFDLADQLTGAANNN